MTGVQTCALPIFRQRSRPYLFSNSLAPSIVGASIAVIDMLSQTTALRDKLWENTRYFREQITKAGFDIKPGEQLQSVFDDNITCTVKNDRWVEFRGEEHSLSSAALAVAHEQGLGWTTIAGPQYWKHGGKTLSELREEATQGA